jgi:ectoine hydroxylase-related dioxygenase (phytanoyl-CoA dioxygenase family)
MSSRAKNIQNDFAKNGVIEIKNFISNPELLELIKNIEIIQKTSDNLVSKYYENFFLIRIENFLEKNSFLKKFINSKKIKSKVDQLIGGKSILFKEKINFKPFGSRKDKLHQDIQAGWSKFDKNMVTCLIAIDHSTTKNGCLEFDVSGNNSKKQRAKSFSPLLVKDLHKPKFKN